jgi:uncharacterized repeat protein (TIGR01451 family)
VLDGTFHHIAGTWDGSTVRLYVDGVPQGTAALSTPANNTRTLNLGYAWGGGTPRRFFRGTVDELTIYHRALEEADIQSSVAAGSAGKCQTVTIVTETLPLNKLGEFSSHQLEAILGTPPYVWAVVAGMLPPGMDLSAEGVLSGTPTEAGHFTFTVRVTDSENDTDEQAVEKEVLVALPPAQLRLNKFGIAPVPGRMVEYFILVENPGKGVEKGFQVIGFIEPWFTFLSADPAPLELTPTGIVIWELPSLNPGDFHVISYQVRLDSTVPLGQEVHGGPECYFTPPRCRANFEECIENSEDTCEEALPEGFARDFCITGAAKFCNQDFHACTAAALGNGEAGTCSTAGALTQGPKDPNEKGAIAKKFIQPNQTLVYPIHFENIGDIEAQDVFVTDVLDANLDGSTVQILTPNGTFDETTRTVRWELLGINLPPGETGNVLVAVKPLPNLPSGTEILNTADIQFEIF